MKWCVLFLFSISAISASGQARLPAGASARADLARLDSAALAQRAMDSEPTRIIVEFRDEPLFIQAMRVSALNKPALAADFLPKFSQLAADAEALRRSLPADITGASTIGRRFYGAFFGASMTVPAIMMPLLQQLPYVKAIHFDREVRATAEPAGALIGADSVRARFGSSGRGIRVGILDTGIDYNHPALGGGFGPGFKVAGGTDLVNGDPDPMDDNGHGTHVAGIVAADGDSAKGIAPGVSLYAVKALDASGAGRESDAIAAIEWAVDPNRDGDPSDRLDVVNMSFGTDGGSPTDASSIAVDNAVRLGIVFCVAAGNSGGRTPVQGKEDNYFYDGSGSISSPGSAERAITVGASDSLDQLATFSSRGPNRVSFGIKPEVLAPGVGIPSTYPGSTYRTLSGTSMSTPMVTGVAALLKSIHPSWGPPEVKSALVNRGKNLGLSAYLQGGGRVQALQAATARTLVVPSTLSFGMDDPSVGTWMRPDTLLVVNADSLPQSYVLTAAGMPPGVSVGASPATLSLPPGASASVVVTIAVNNALVANEPENILRYTGSLSVMGNNDTARVPWAFARANRLVVTTSEPGAYFLGYSDAAVLQSTDKTVNWTSPTRAEVYAPAKGTYEFFTVFRNPAGKSKIVITEGISILSDAAETSLNGGNAVYPLIFRGVDHAGNPLGAYRSPRRTLMTTLPNFGDWITTLTGGSDTLLLSPVPATHSFRPIESQLNVSAGGTFHVAPFARFSGMNGPVTLLNSPVDYLQQHFRVNVPPGTTRVANIGVFYNYQYVAGTGLLGGFAAAIDTMTVSGDEYAFTGYFGKASSATEDIAAIFYTSFTDFAHLSLDYESPVIMPYRDSLVATSREYVSPATPRFESGATMTLGGIPVHLLTLWYNNSFGSPTLLFRVLPRGMLHETLYNHLLSATYTVIDPNGAELFTRSLVDPHFPVTLPVNRYRVIIRDRSGWLRHAGVSTALTSEFNLGNDLTVIPPTLMSLSVLDNRGHPTDSLARGEPARLRFAFNEIGFQGNVLPLFDSTKAWYRKHGTTSWTPLSVTKIADAVASEGTIVDADLRPATAEDSVGIDLRVATVDVNGFRVDYEVSPAFAVGNWDTTAVTDVPGGGDPGVPAELILAQNFPNPFNPSTVIRYGLPGRLEVTLKVYNLLGQEVASLVNGSEAAGFHEVRLNAAGLASGVYFYRLQAGSHVRSGKMLLLK